MAVPGMPVPSAPPARPKRDPGLGVRLCEGRKYNFSLALKPEWVYCISYVLYSSMATSWNLVRSAGDQNLTTEKPKNGKEKVKKR